MSDDKTRVLDLLADGLGHGFDCAKIRHALAEIIEAHECQGFDEWLCENVTEQACPVAIAAAHLLKEER